MPSVSIIRCADYDRAAVRAAVRAALEALPLPELAGKRLLLKPNLLSSDDTPLKPVNTHPEVVRAVAEFFLERGTAHIHVGDSCGSLSPGSTRRAIENTGLNEVASDLGLELFNVDLMPHFERAIPEGILMRKAVLPELLDKIDLLVTIPKMKTHSLTAMTGAVKNQFGLMPGKHKKDVHLLAPQSELFAQTLVDLFTVTRPHLAIMDGIIAMEGNGPAAGRARDAGLILASNSAPAMDMAVAVIMGLDPMEVDTLRLAAERGLGPGQIDEISFAGVPLEEAAIQNFHLPPLKARRALFKLLPDFVIRWAFQTVGSAKPYIRKERCQSCGECITNCPAHAMRMENARVLVDEEKCISCYCCTEVCAFRAVKLRRPPLGRALQAVYRLSGVRRRAGKQKGISQKETANADR